MNPKSKRTRPSENPAKGPAVATFRRSSRLDTIFIILVMAPKEPICHQNNSLDFQYAFYNIVQCTCILEKARLNGQYNCNLPGANEANLLYKTTNNISKQVAEKFKTTNIAIQKTPQVKSHHLSIVQTFFRISCNL